jgi:hypothetical protein
LFEIPLKMPTIHADVEDRIEWAIRDVRSGKKCTFREAAAYYYLPYDILIARARGRPTNHSRGGQNKIFSEEDTATLRRFCERCILSGDPPERKHIKAAANSIRRAQGKPPVSNPWVTRWIKKNSDLLKKKRSKSLAVERKQTHEVEEIRAHFRRFEEARDKYEILPDNTWNFDETGWRIGCLQGRIVFTFPDVAAVYMSDPDVREMCTGLEAISGGGRKAPSMLILPGTELLEHHFNNNIDSEVLFGTNKETGSGYTNDQLALDWLEHFEYHTRPGRRTRRGVEHNGQWRMLVMDGHGSHLTLEFVDYCWDHKIVPFKLIPHSTHLLQPCDVGYFQPMKQHYQNILADQIRYGGAQYTKDDFLDAFNEVSIRTAKESTIKHAWAKAGLIPFNPSIVLEKMKKMEPPQRILNPDRFITPEPEFLNQEMDWNSCITPEQSLVAIRPYSEYIDRRISAAIDGTINLTPSVARATDKRNKALNIMVMEGILKGEELDKRRAEEARKARHKIEGGARRVATHHGVITKGDARLRIAGRAQYLAQEKAKRQQALIKKIEKLGGERWRITSNQAVRWRGRWQAEKTILLRRYKCWMAKLLHYHKTGNRILLTLDD